MIYNILNHDGNMTQIFFRHNLEFQPMTEMTE